MKNKSNITVMRILAVALWMVSAMPEAAGQVKPEQAAPAEPGGTTQPVTQDEDKQLFSVSIDNAEIKDVLESLAYQAGLSLVLTEEVDGKISLYLKDVTWQTAFNAILQAGGCTTLKKDQVLIVLKASDQEQAATEAQLTTQKFDLNFANAADLETTVSGLLTEDGRTGTDLRLNSILVTDTADNLNRIGQTLEMLDVRAPQVMIEVLIVNVNLTDELKLGIDWTELGKDNYIFSQGLSVTSGVNPFGQVDFSVPSNDWSITGLMDFVESNGNIKVVANPKVMVLNNHTATFKSVEEVPYRELSETSEGGSIGTTSFKDVGVTLEVTPQITKDGFILMHIAPEQSVQTDTFIIQGSETPVVDSRNIDTSLQVKDGQTIIISGLRKVQQIVKEDKIPIMGDLPLIGVLFRNVRTENGESELGVFITPHIYTDGALSPEETELLEMLEKDTEKSLFQLSDPLRLSRKD